ncbi:3-hydroxyisobutyrate dehydrogenase [Marinivivus vitaminiproducens]|uniref:3-hydroxyisobutyrate dehydrogenase n=1 Tax=Marinivivus vitaminiproducens TaxID=3035935 RepID=UPI00279CB2F8|nr:3-hydroxyisobutyrate dehydrogenase [Geminicoccaceae bacterium SCSIO 64248]
MTRIGFIGLGHMGLPMARHLLAAGHHLAVHDAVAAKAASLTDDRARTATSVAEATRDAEIVITMLPEGRHVQEVYTTSDGVIANAPRGCLLIDCSTIDVETARAVSVAAAGAGRGLDMLDAPVSGGVSGAEGAALTFMVGGSETAFARARPVLASMGKRIVHAGAAGAGQAAKICNNLILGVSMIAVGEAFQLADRLGLARDKLFEVSAHASGQCWALTSYCPVPGPVPASPANRNYQPGFTSRMMRKDLKLAVAAARATGAVAPLSGEACHLYDLFCRSGGADLDFSAIIKLFGREIDA